VRVWPLSYFPDTYAKNISDEGIIKEKSGFKAAFRAAVEKAAKAPSLKTSVLLGAKDGFFLSISILGNILIIGTLSLLLVHHSSFFQLLSKPLIPLVKILHPVDAELISAAAVAGISEMFVPVLMVQSASVETKFFIAILSISQLIFFSSVGPMILTMFRELPVRFYHLIALFIIRTALLIPLITFICYLLNSLGMLQ
ncbi:MAG: YjiH family protein, partial [Chlamydiales bacterium]|nr:YjiH family protein [Chlamydiales bacterium]